MAKKAKTRETLELINVIVKDTFDSSGNLDEAPALDNGTLLNEVRMEGTVKKTQEDIFFKVTVYSHANVPNANALCIDGMYLLKGCTHYKKDEKVATKLKNIDGTPYTWQPERATILAGTGIYKGKPE